MATLTKSWKSYASTSVTKSGQTIRFYLEAKYNSQSVANNSTIINTRLRSEVDGAIRGTGYEFTCSYCSTRKGTGIWTFADEVIISSPDTTITHNSDGTKSLSLKATAKNTYWSISKSLSATVDLPTIPRQASITSAPNFTDEENPTINYSNPAGNSVSSLQACISLTGSTDDIVYRDISKTGSSYTFNLTTAERNVLRNATITSNTRSVKFFVRTIISGNTFYNNVERTLTIVNANPNETTTFEERNTKVSNLLGSTSASTIVQNASVVRMTSTPTLLKNATLKQYQFINGNTVVPVSSSPYQADIVPTTNTFTTTIIDSRNNSKVNTYTKTMIDYIPVDIISYSFKRVNPTSDDILLNATINYKQTSFNGTTNVPTIQWKVGEEGQLNTLSSSDYTIDTTNNKITIYNLTLQDALNYQSEARFYLYASDLLTEDTENFFVTKGRPTFEAGEHDLKVNGDLYIADTGGNNAVNVGDTLDWLKTQKILWNDYYYMNQNQTANLSENISDQPHGIILVWCGYANGSPQNYDWVFTHIPKGWIAINGEGAGVCVTMSNLRFTAVGAKYVYVYDDHITGHADNEGYGTNSGITYDNRHWVLRYVIGV